MIKTNSLLLCFLLLFVGVSCTGEKEHSAKYVRNFDLDKSVQMDLSDFVDSISLIPLATTDASLIKHVSRLVYVNGCFYINDNQGKILAFDRSGTFSFLRKHWQETVPMNTLIVLISMYWRMGI